MFWIHTVKANSKLAFERFKFVYHLPFMHSYLVTFEIVPNGWRSEEWRHNNIFEGFERVIQICQGYGAYKIVLNHANLCIFQISKHLAWSPSIWHESQTIWHRFSCQISSAQAKLWQMWPPQISKDAKSGRFSILEIQDFDNKNLEILIFDPIWVVQNGTKSKLF